MKQLLLSLRGVKRIYTSGEQKIEVLHGIDLDIYKGELVAIIGASGSGKSTLMNILGCLDKPSEGSYEIDGVSTQTLYSDQLAALRRNYFGFMPEPAIRNAVKTQENFWSVWDSGIKPNICRVSCQAVSSSVFQSPAP